MNNPIVEFFNTPFAITAVVSWLVLGIILLFLIGLFILVSISDGYKEAKEDQRRYKILVDGKIYDNVQYKFEKSANVVHIEFNDSRRSLTLSFHTFEELEVYENE